MLARLRTPLLIFATGFLALFMLRLGYQYWNESNRAPSSSRSQVLNSGSWNFAKDVRNFASYKTRKGGGGILSTFSSGGGKSARATPDASASVPTGAEQKYEKIANIGLVSEEFESDETKVRKLIAEQDALIQFERRQGLKGRRTLQLAIGVNPNDFDTMVEKFQTYGELRRLTIDKSDKTNEYRDLQAKRLALEKTREALSALKQREGQIKDHVELEKQILSLEQQVQALGVSLGDFDAENEFITVKLYLAEAFVIVRATRSLIDHAFRALEWTIYAYAITWLGIAAFLIAAFLGTHLLRFAVNLATAAEAKQARG
ncbi:MAG: DUF4349 domain-containing protein [Filomicrobium sp.]